VYGVSQYVVVPMLASLAAARHALATTTLAGLEQFNARLEQMVTVVPPAAAAAATKSTTAAAGSAAKTDKDDGGGSGDGGGGGGSGGGDGGDDNRSDTSSDSDPTELFHIDAGTQTTPSLLSSPRRPASPSSSSSSSPLLAETSEAPDAAHVDDNADDDGNDDDSARMRRLRQELVEARALTDSAADADADFAQRVADFAAYLGSLPASSTNSSNLSYQRTAGGGSNSGNSDAVAATKTEIRGIKSILLNAKNFPSGGSSRATLLAGRSPVS
jgi:hypothetical protein